MRKILFLFVMFIFLVSCQKHALDTTPVQQGQEQKQQAAATTPEPVDTGNVSDNVDTDIASVDEIGDDLGVLNDEDDIDLNLSSFDDW